MGRINSRRRSMAIRIKRERRKKLAKLRQKYLRAETEERKERILTKVLKLTPQLTQKEFLSLVEKKNKDNG